MRLRLTFLLLSLCLQGCFSWLNSNSAKEALAEAADPMLNSYLSAQEKKRLNRNYPQTKVKVEEGRQLSLQDVIRLTKCGIPDEKIIFMIQISKTIFYLTADDRMELRHAGLSNKVIDAMEETGESIRNKFS